MPVASGIICLWTGTNASIPANWTRETTLDARYPKGAATGVDPGATGGALTHSHTTPTHVHTAAHTHTVPNSPAGSGTTARDSATTNPPDTHTHDSNPATANPTVDLPTSSPSTDTINHEPSNFVVIFIKSDGTPTGFPVDAVIIWDDAAGAPAGWNLADGGGTPARPNMSGRYLKGAAAGGDGGGTGGALTHSHAVASHDHQTNFVHGHPDVTSSQKTQANVAGSISGANAGTATSTHTHTLTIGSQSTVAITANTDSTGANNHEPPFRVEAYIQNNSGGQSLPANGIAIWTGTLASIPADWVLCDGTLGTPDLRSTYVKGATVLADIGGTGGSLTHNHTATGHTHAVASHAHTVSAGTGAGENRTAGATNAATTAHTHPSWSDTGATAFTSATGTPTIDNYTDTQPTFTGVAFVQYQPSTGQPTMRRWGGVPNMAGRAGHHGTVWSERSLEWLRLLAMRTRGLSTTPAIA